MSSLTASATASCPMKLACAGVILLFACGCSSSNWRSPKDAGAVVAAHQADGVIPPTSLPRRDIAPPETPLPGQQIALCDSCSNRFTLFLPDRWQVPSSGKIKLTVHFHTAAWFAIEEHLRHGLRTPLLAAYLGEGSSVYRRPFEDPNRFKEWLDLADRAIEQRTGVRTVRVTAVDISSFSAGYGAVRELVKSLRYFKLVERIVLCDSLYGSLQNTNPASPRIPAWEHVRPWVAFASAAAHGQKVFLLTHSEVPTSYASSAEMATALIKAVHAPIRRVFPMPAADDPGYRLRYRSDLHGFHVWGYSGIDGSAHLTHARHLAECWLALDGKKLPAAATSLGGNQSPAK